MVAGRVRFVCRKDSDNFDKQSDLFDICCRKDANFAATLSEPPAVLLLVVDVDHVAVADAQLVIPAQGGTSESLLLSYTIMFIIMISYMFAV